MEDEAACRAVLAKHWVMVLAHMVVVNTGAMQRGKQAWGHDKASK